MKKRVKIKQSKFKNINRINSILSKTNYRVWRKRFGSGYYIENIYNKCSICWFWLKEFPEWRFGIWLEKNGFSIFGEHENQINKFKPSYTYVSEDNIDEFNNELKSILLKDKKHKKYLKNIENEKKYEQKKDLYNFNSAQSIKNFIKDFNKKNKEKIVLKLNDRGSSTMPRYRMDILYYSKDFYLTKEEEYQLYLDISKNKYFDETIYNEIFLVDSFIADFDHFQCEILNEKEFEIYNIKYNWNQTFKEYIYR